MSALGTKRVEEKTCQPHRLQGRVLYVCMYRSTWSAWQFTAIATHHTSDITHFLAAVGGDETRDSEAAALSTNAVGLYHKYPPPRIGYPRTSCES